jgi:hypothetical protein
MGIKFLRLGVGIKDSEIGCRITATARSPLPPPIVAGQFKVEQFFGKVSFAPSPVDEQVFHQKGCGYHSDTVVHETRSVEFTHAGINNWISGISLAPCLKLGGVVSPFDPVVCWFKCMVGDMGEMPQYHLVKISPDEFTEEGITVLLPRQRRYFPNADSAKTEMNAEF